MLMEQGLSVVHLFGKLTPTLDREAVVAAVKSAEAADCQVITAAMLGHKSDVGFMALCADWRTLRRLQTELQQAGLDIVDSYVSITEISEYTKGMPDEMLRGRLTPTIPPEGLNAFCFYPMSKKREQGANWFATPFERRYEMMMEHGKSGRQFAGKVAQVISGSTGLDDFEWGVTLFAKSPDVVKEVVYTMRFDEGSALYGEFGAFYVGYLEYIENIF
ncbi:MAG: chlorite dismutase family protein [Actinomycetota bacterium]|jgi:hydrogen peroxide-dependent heme synthase|uniref:chlorite dismutase family protein n=1 Tax=uncultured Ilumatobacter sp. TaxID=879968 RepID=UPI00374F6873|nr:chlorite dismutase family protein [Actinomycetota bacterium]